MRRRRAENRAGGGPESANPVNLFTSSPFRQGSQWPTRNRVKGNDGDVPRRCGKSVGRPRSRRVAGGVCGANTATSRPSSPRSPDRHSGAFERLFDAGRRAERGCAPRRSSSMGEGWVLRLIKKSSLTTDSGDATLSWALWAPLGAELWLNHRRAGAMSGLSGQGVHLVARDTSSALSAADDKNISSLLAGVAWSGLNITYSFPTASAL